MRISVMPALALVAALMLGCGTMSPDAASSVPPEPTAGHPVAPVSMPRALTPGPAATEPAMTEPPAATAAPSPPAEAPVSTGALTPEPPTLAPTEAPPPEGVRTSAPVASPRPVEPPPPEHTPTPSPTGSYGYYNPHLGPTGFFGYWRDSHLFVRMSVADEVAAVYQGAQWGQWVDDDDDCLNTRHEALLAHSETPVTYADEGECRVARGRWTDAFTGEVLEDADDVAVVHMVPLPEAHRSGGHRWTSAGRVEYRNHLAELRHLRTVSRATAAARAERGPHLWRPESWSHWCDYAMDWIGVKGQWNLSVGEAERQALEEMLNICPFPARMTVIDK